MRYKSIVSRRLQQSQNQLANLVKQLNALGLPEEQKDALVSLAETSKQQVEDALNKVELEDEYHGM